VQLNLPLRDPLVGTPGPLPPARPVGPWHRRSDAAVESDPAAIRLVVDAAVSRRGVILAGRSAGSPLDGQAVHAMGRALGWPVIADPRSGCRTPGSTTVSHIDALVRVGQWADAHVPEVVIQLGEPPASKVVGQWIAASGATVLAVDPDGWWFDADRQVAALVVADPSRLARDIAGGLRPIDAVDASWCRSFVEADRRAAQAIEDLLAARDGATEPGVARAALAGVPDGGAMVVASSMPVRDVEWFGAPRTNARVVSNRGANGIDGVTSTAVGVALTGVPTVCLLGDVAFLHDTNGLLGAAARDVDLVLVDIDNDGGGIFSFLPQASQLGAERFEMLFGTPHGVDVAAIAAAHGIASTVVDSAAGVGQAVAEAVDRGGVHLVVARTDRGANVVLHDDLNASIAAAVLAGG
jgi:2-succinyl-5-enolpyruvyl-6-hydroxy-3-cyclohexene-1-carboxylate synthase